MKKFISIILLVLFSIFPHFAFSMDEGQLDPSSYASTRAAHNFTYSDGNLTLRCPQTDEERKSCHTIRTEEIHKRYCQGSEYNYKNPEEERDTNLGCCS